ncbi:hypothetical protein, partial [Capnocytophaga leadbetteri]|uniref:hypothetical protein n=1 Tax=Capnocytophaga leadbetteri TaxID=327575 RepID=UPI00288A9081
IVKYKHFKQALLFKVGSDNNPEDLRNCRFEEGIFLFGSVAKTLWIRIECKKSFNILIENLRLFSTFAVC